MIDHQHRAIFIHQRKVAGMSISQMWGYKIWDIANLRSDYHRFNEGVLSWDWNTRTEVEKGYFVFSAVRNPFDRLVSSWKFLERTRARPLIEVLENLPRETPDYEHLTRPQIAILRELGSSTLVVDDLIRFESLQQDFDRICDRIGKPRASLPHVNTSERERGYRQYFDARTRKLTEDVFAEDFEVFGYTF
jgi:hypothetical protein